MDIDKTLYSGRPQESVSNEERQSYALLDGLGIEYKRVQHGEAATIEDCRAVEELLDVKICKNLFLTNSQKTNFYLLVMPGEKKFKTKDVSRQIGSARLSFAGEEHMRQILGVAPGSVSVLALANGRAKEVTLVIDKDILKEECFGCHPCKNTASLSIKTKELTGKILPALDVQPIYVEL